MRARSQRGSIPSETLVAFKIVFKIVPAKTASSSVRAGRRGRSFDLRDERLEEVERTPELGEASGAFADRDREDTVGGEHIASAASGDQLDEPFRSDPGGRVEAERHARSAHPCLGDAESLHSPPELHHLEERLDERGDRTEAVADLLRGASISSRCRTAAGRL
jgi:hypothetical protein